MVPQLKLCELKQNSGIVSDFQKYLRNLRFSSSSEDDVSTIRKMSGHLFFYPDSLLHFLHDKIPDYNLERHLQPLKDDFIELEDPTKADGWLQSISGNSGKEQPGRRKEMMKAHSRWRDYCVEKISEADFGLSDSNVYKKEKITKNRGEDQEEASIY